MSLGSSLHDKGPKMNKCPFKCKSTLSILLECIKMKTKCLCDKICIWVEHKTGKGTAERKEFNQNLNNNECKRWNCIRANEYSIDKSECINSGWAIKSPLCPINKFMKMKFLYALNLCVYERQSHLYRLAEWKCLYLIYPICIFYCILFRQFWFD